MLRKELAAALSLSGAMVSRLAKRGMPTHDVEAARRWRDRHLEPARRKEHRFDPGRHPAASPAAVPDDGPALLIRAQRSMALAGELLPLGKLANIHDMLQADMRAVPLALRPELLLHFEVVDLLVADVLTALRDDETDDAAAPVPLSEVEAEEMGAFWYGVACGEIVATRAAGEALP